MVCAFSSPVQKHCAVPDCLWMCKVNLDKLKTHKLERNFPQALCERLPSYMSLSIVLFFWNKVHEVQRTNCKGNCAFCHLAPPPTQGTIARLPIRITLAPCRNNPFLWRQFTTGVKSTNTVENVRNKSLVELHNSSLWDKGFPHSECVIKDLVTPFLSMTNNLQEAKICTYSKQY